MNRWTARVLLLLMLTGTFGPVALAISATSPHSGLLNLGERRSVGLSALNFTNYRYMLDNRNTFGGTHFVNPGEVIAL